ncbi:MAG TPA: response regulator transcription factor [Actinospica sp.]|nr:response regulator transcription factor [Actinospica sp.]
MAIGVFVVDDQELLRLGVAALFEVEGDIELVGEAARAADAPARIQATRPDVVLLDTRLPDGEGAALCREIRAAPNPAACLMLAAAEDDPALMDALDAGAAGYLLKSVHGPELVEAVRKVAAGGSLLDASGSDGLLERMRSEAAKSDPLRGLSATDRGIVRLIGEGLTNRQIGLRLNLSERTIKNHVSHVLTVLGMERRTQIAVLAASLKPEGAR